MRLNCRNATLERESSQLVGTEQRDAEGWYSATPSENLSNRGYSVRNFRTFESSIGTVKQVSSSPLVAMSKIQHPTRRIYKARTAVIFARGIKVPGYKNNAVARTLDTFTGLFYWTSLGGFVYRDFTILALIFRDMVFYYEFDFFIR